ncbi:MAG: hypothetical protein ACRCUC_10225 [Aestuariivirga sp.]
MSMMIHRGEAIWDGDFSLLGRNFVTGETVWIRERDDGGFDIRHDQDVEPLLKTNVEVEKETYGKRFGDWNRIASVPDNVAMATGLDEAHKQGDKKFIKRFFNDADNRKFRTSRGSV